MCHYVTVWLRRSFAGPSRYGWGLALRARGPSRRQGSRPTERQVRCPIRGRHRLVSFRPALKSDMGACVRLWLISDFARILQYGQTIDLHAALSPQEHDALVTHALQHG